MIEISKSEVHLWFASQHDFDYVKLKKTCRNWLTKNELIRLNSFFYERHRAEYLLGKILIRNVLSQYSCTKPWCWRFDENEFGKPILNPEHEQGLSFNLSHSRNRLVVAICKANALGIDLERSDRVRRVVAIARRCFSNSEIKALLALPDSERLSRFYDLWTLKEAYIKASGFGLTFPMRQLSFCFSDDKLSICFAEGIDEDPTKWQIWQMSHSSLYKIALAIKSDAQITQFVSRKFLTMSSFQIEVTPIIRST